MKKKYVAERTSSFMKFDQGNKWVVVCPDGLIYGTRDEGTHFMSQNEAIRLAKKLNEEMTKCTSFE